MSIVDTVFFSVDTRFCLQSKGGLRIKQWIGVFVAAFGSDWLSCNLMVIQENITSIINMSLPEHRNIALSLKSIFIFPFQSSSDN